MKLQLLTTREPDLSQLEVAIAALQAVLALEKPGELTAEDLVGVEVVAYGDPRTPSRIDVDSAS